MQKFSLLTLTSKVFNSQSHKMIDKWRYHMGLRHAWVKSTASYMFSYMYIQCIGLNVYIHTAFMFIY